mmetsp:Transcript_10430/g.19755  ORF Transcript_10430/g.19755 Transcript_10430/m.19755 type:complete len:151 (+) Transcript_10430:73-525(+)|eukprot:CAMPEP_0175130030 /NCGR_PEP_ID=MMETSP0087-20121206/5790_1 /TAXON_ID=136419 /ORGANISM="Unknown Unknown, Strain D1" /LENGTH=150 /DNA_ID=CAMNT_0016412223 /DNA_START=73 /DNA_END=525 /DNA_ORIENTATION=-
MGCGSSASTGTLDARQSVKNYQNPKHPDYDPKYKHYQSNKNPNQPYVEPEPVVLSPEDEAIRKDLCDQLFKLINTSGSGEVSIIEFMAWVKPPEHLLAEEKAKRKDMNAWLLFRVDRDKNSSIDREEMDIFFTKFTVEEARHLLNQSLPK